jgi:hypothetical protein
VDPRAAFASNEQIGLITAMIDGTATWPARLRLMYYDPSNPGAKDTDSADTKGNPAYTHETNAHDSGNHHDAAGELAVVASARLISRMLQ